MYLFENGILLLSIQRVAMMQNRKMPMAQQATSFIGICRVMFGIIRKKLLSWFIMMHGIDLKARVKFVDNVSILKSNSL